MDSTETHPLAHFQSLPTISGGKSHFAWIFYNFSSISMEDLNKILKYDEKNGFHFIQVKGFNLHYNHNTLMDCKHSRYSSNQDHFNYIKDFSQFLVHDTFKSYYLSHYSHLISDLQKYELMIPRNLPRNTKSKLICEAILNIVNKLELHELGLEHSKDVEECGKIKTKLTEKLNYFQNQLLNSNSDQGSEVRSPMLDESNEHVEQNAVDVWNNFGESDPSICSNKSSQCQNPMLSKESKMESDQSESEDLNPSQSNEIQMAPTPGSSEANLDVDLKELISSVKETAKRFQELSEKIDNNFPKSDETGVRLSQDMEVLKLKLSQFILDISKIRQK